MLLPVVEQLQRHGVVVALGGSGLLQSLGLAEGVRDWDLTSDAHWERVEQALAGLAWRQAPCGDGPFASRYRIAMMAGDKEVDLMGAFAIRTEAGVVALPTVVCSEWQGVPVGSPEVWAVAYRLMGRHAKADLLSGWLRENGARAEVVDRLLREPLPPELRLEIGQWKNGRG